MGAEQHQTVDLLITHGYVVTMDRDRRIVRDGALALRGNRIVEVGKTADLAARFECSHIVDAAGKMVLPGFIDAHNHPNQFLSKGIGDDVDVMTWLTRRVYPYEAHLTPDDSYIGALGNFVEMVRSGTTCFNDLGSYFPESVAAAATAVGIRGVLNRSTRDLPEPALDESVVGKLFEDTQTALDEADEFVKRWHGAENDRFHAWYSLRYTISVTDELAVGIGELANRQGVGIHTHAAVGDYENEISLGRFGKRSLERLHDLGLFGPNLCLVHMGAPSPAEIELVKGHDAKVVHCPSASMFGAYAVIANKRIPEMAARGITIGLGTDSATAGRFLDMVRCMYLAACAHKDAYEDPEVMGAYKTLEMATIDGARACLWDADIGSLESGKYADIVLIDMTGLEWVPCPDPIRHLVYSATGSSVDTVIIDGTVVMKNRVLISVDEEWVKHEVARASDALMKRGDIRCEAPWPVV